MKIKILLSVFLFAGIMSACSNKQEEEKNQLNAILKVHDEVMGKSETAMKNKMQLDSLIKKANSNAKTDSAATLSKQLAVADSAMENWMHQFNPDYSGKSHDEIMTYLQNQRAQLLQVDTLLKAAISQSGAYLKTK
jgi:hypothetical protein